VKVLGFVLSLDVIVHLVDELYKLYSSFFCLADP